MWSKIRCDGESWKDFGFWGELNKASVLGFCAQSELCVAWHLRVRVKICDADIYYLRAMSSIANPYTTTNLLIHDGFLVTILQNITK